MKKKSVLTLLLVCGLMAGENEASVLAAEQASLPAGQQEEAAVQESVSGNDAAENPGVSSPDENASGTQAYVSRVVSFTDYTGMRVTYDANVSLKYVYEVSDGVLTAVKEKKSDEKGAETLTEVSFEGNVELKQPEEGEKYTSVSADVFAGNQEITYVKLPSGVTAVAGAGFKGCTSLKSVYLPSTVTELGEGAFEGCTALTQLSLSKSVTTIGDNAFKGDEKLQLLQLRDTEESGLMSVGAYAFAGCRNLEQMVLPKSVAALGDFAFQGCSALMRVEVNCDQMTIGRNAFPGASEAGGLVIVAGNGSSAEAYAQENGLAFHENT